MADESYKANTQKAKRARSQGTLSIQGETDQLGALSCDNFAHLYISAQIVCDTKSGPETKEMRNFCTTYPHRDVFIRFKLKTPFALTIQLDESLLYRLRWSRHYRRKCTEWFALVRSRRGRRGCRRECRKSPKDRFEG